MNPIIRHRYLLVRYVALYALSAGVYAAVFGIMGRMAVGYTVLDWAVFTVVSGFEELILWSILKYGTEGIRTPALKAGFYTVTGILFAAVAVGAECAAMYAALSPAAESPAAWPEATTGTFGTFAATIPARSLCALLVYVCFALWYSHAARADDERAFPVAAPAAPQPAPIEIERVTVRGGGGKIEVIGVSEIVYLQAEGDYVAIATASGRWLKEGTMKYFEEALPRGGFVRVHRSYIVSVAHIGRIESSGRDRTVIMRSCRRADGGGVVIPISDAGYRVLRQVLGL